jgi:predicted membrane-bound spermidine synthase
MNGHNVNKYIIFLIILLEGLVSISVEIIAIRQITPFVGSNIINTSLVIGSFLLFLAIGYYHGGSVKENFFKRLTINLLISQVLIAIGLSYGFLLHFFDLIDNNYLFVTLFSFLIVGTIVYFLGQTIPILSNFFKSQNIGRVNGTILFLSTFGSFLGSVIVATIAFNFLGVNNTIILVVFILFIVAIFLYTQTKQLLTLILSFSIVILSIVVNPKVFIKNNSYSNMEIKEILNRTILVVNRSWSSGIENSSEKPYFWYVRELEKFISKKTRNKQANILVAGAGGFTIGLNDTRNKYMYIDIDKDLQSVSQKHLIKQKVNGEFIVSGIRSYLKTSKQKYDFIILDTYSNETTIPPFHTTVNYMNEIQHSLKENGMAIFNIIADSNFHSTYSKNIHETINAMFYCSITPQRLDSKEVTNILYFCRPKKSRGRIYNDNNVNLFDLIKMKP